MVRNIAPYLDPRLRGGDIMGSKLPFFAAIGSKLPFTAAVIVMQVTLPLVAAKVSA